MRKTAVKDFEIAVLGAGTMGLCVAQFFAMNGHEVNLYNRTYANLDKALVQIRNNLQTLVSINQIKKSTLSFIGNGVLFKINLHDFIIHNNWTLK